MIKLSRKKLVIWSGLALVVLVTVGVLLLVLPKVRNKTNTSEFTIPEDAVVLEQHVVDKTSEYRKILNPEIDYWDDWNWENKMLIFKVIDVNTDNGYVRGYILMPEAMSSTEEVVLRHPTCDSEKVFSVSKDSPATGIIDENYDFMSKVSEDDIFYAQCLDSECLNLGGACILVEF